MRRARLAHPRRHARGANKPVAYAPNPRFLIAEPPDTGGSVFPNECKRTKSARPAPHLTFATQSDANTGVFHSTKGLRQGPGPAKQCAKPRSAKLRLASRLPQPGTMGSGVQFCEYSACKAVCIRIGSVNQRLQAHIYCVLEQTSRSDGTQARASRAQRRESIASEPVCCKIAAVPTAPRC